MWAREEREREREERWQNLMMRWGEPFMNDDVMKVWDFGSKKKTEAIKY